MLSKLSDEARFFPAGERAQRRGTFLQISGERFLSRATIYAEMDAFLFLSRITGYGSRNGFGLIKFVKLPAKRLAQ
jgi:hypothetical protein